MKFIIFLALCIGYTCARQSDYCFAYEDNPYLQFATLTPYTVSTKGYNQYKQIRDCQPRQIWMLTRHGIRYPNSENIAKLLELRNVRDQIVMNHEQRRDGRLCNEDLENLKRWSQNSNITLEMAKRLTPQGYTENKLLAQQIRDAFSQLFPWNQGDMNPENYVFRTTKSERTQSSMEAFMDGLFNGRRFVTPSQAYGNDTLLKAYQHCPRWDAGTENDPRWDKELNEWLGGREFSDVIHNVSSRLGFQYDLTADKIQTMYDMCRFDKAWALEKLSPWCGVFTADELKVLEYAQDLDYYYGAGYGREVNKIIGCSALQDMMNRFRQAERDGDNRPKGTFYFTHAFTILSFLRNLEVFKDYEPLLATNYMRMMRRQWRTSTLTPFNANILAIFYKCNDPSSANKVMFYLQGKPLNIEGCQVGLCNWEFLKSKYEDAVSQQLCSEQRCYGNSSILHQALITLISLLSLGSLLLK